MTEKEANKVLAKEKKRLDKEFATNFKKVRKKLGRLNLVGYLKRVIIADLEQVNGDLMDVLLIPKQFTSLNDYKRTIFAYLLSETMCYDYSGIELKYKVGTMQELMTIIRNQHKIIDQKERLKKIVGM